MRVFIEKSFDPITVLLQSDDGVVWEFEGATERVVRAMIVTPNRDCAAVRGPAVGAVDFLKLLRCPSKGMPLGNVVERGADDIFRSYLPG